MHIGKAIKDELERQGKNAAWFAEQLPCHRTHVYHIFKQSSIDTQLLERISKILKHDFFTEYAKTLNQLTCSIVCYSSTTYYNFLDILQPYNLSLLN